MRWLKFIHSVRRSLNGTPAKQRRAGWSVVHHGLGACWRGMSKCIYVFQVLFSREIRCIWHHDDIITLAAQSRAPDAKLGWRPREPCGCGALHACASGEAAQGLVGPGIRRLPPCRSCQRRKHVVASWRRMAGFGVGPNSFTLPMIEGSALFAGTPGSSPAGLQGRTSCGGAGTPYTAMASGDYDSTLSGSS